MLVCHWTAVLFWSSHCPSSAQLSRAVLSVHLSWGTQWTPKLMLSGDVPRMMPNQGEDIAEFPLQFYVFALRMPIAGKNTSVWWQYIIQWDFFFFLISLSHSVTELQRLAGTSGDHPVQAQAAYSTLLRTASSFEHLQGQRPHNLHAPTTFVLLPVCQDRPWAGGPWKSTCPPRPFLYFLFFFIFSLKVTQSIVQPCAIFLSWEVSASSTKATHRSHTDNIL